MPVQVPTTISIVVHSVISKQIKLKRERQWTARNKAV